MSKGVDAIERSILHVLGIYPVLSHSMLQIGLGTKVKPSIWKPILNDMIKRRIVETNQVIVQTPSGRHRFYTKLQLPHA